MTTHETTKIDALNVKVDRILTYLENDDATGSKGLVARTAILEKKVQTSETNEKIKRAKMSVLTIVGSAIISFLAWLFK
jgi:hypothetical protein